MLIMMTHFFGIYNYIGIDEYIISLEGMKSHMNA